MVAIRPAPPPASYLEPFRSRCTKDDLGGDGSSQVPLWPLDGSRIGPREACLPCLQTFAAVPGTAPLVGEWAQRPATGARAPLAGRVASEICVVGPARRRPSRRHLACPSTSTSPSSPTTPAGPAGRTSTHRRSHERGLALQALRLRGGLLSTAARRAGAAAGRSRLIARAGRPNALLSQVGCLGHDLARLAHTLAHLSRPATCFFPLSLPRLALSDRALTYLL